MFQIAKKILSIVLVAFLIVGAVPKRADAVIPGIAAAAAALGCSEGTLVAVGGGLLAAGGIVAAGESEQVKVVSAAVAGLGSAALERLSAAVNAVGPGGEYTLPIDALLASTIGEMVQNVEDVASSGEDIEYQIITGGTGPGDYIDFNAGPVLLGNIYGVVAVVVEDFYVHNYALDSQVIEIKTNVQPQWFDGIRVYKTQGDESTVYLNVEVVHDTTTVYHTDFAYPCIWGYYAHLGQISFGAGVSQEGELAYFLNGEMIWNGEAGDHKLVQIGSISESGSQTVSNSYMYDISEVGVAPLYPSDYTNAGLTPEQIAALAGTTITGDVVTNVYNPPAINPPVTWPEATDLTGVIGALQNVWNSVTQGFARVYTYLQAIVDSISTTLDPNILQEPINDLKTFITGKVPELPDLDTSGFSEREWSWMVTINHPINISFEVLNSQTLESARPTIKGFTSGILILLTTIYMYRRIPEIVKG